MVSNTNNVKIITDTINVIELVTYIHFDSDKATERNEGDGSLLHSISFVNATQ